MRMQEDFIFKGVRYLSLGVLLLSIAIFEVAYKKDKMILIVNGLEILVLACITLTSSHISTIIKLNFQQYVLYLTYAFLLYYLLKSIIIYTIEKRKYFDGLSDIHEILKKNRK